MWEEMRGERRGAGLGWPQSVRPVHFSGSVACHPHAQGDVTASSYSTDKKNEEVRGPRDRKFAHFTRQSRYLRYSGK